MLANARKTLSRSAKTPEGATTRSKAVPNKNNKSILKGKTSVEDEPEESEDEEPEAAEEELPTQKDRDPAVKQVPTTAVPRSVQKRVEFEVLPEGGFANESEAHKVGNDTLRGYTTHEPGFATEETRRDRIRADTCH